jgi:hypothetical protein
MFDVFCIRRIVSVAVWWSLRVGVECGCKGSVRRSATVLLAQSEALAVCRPSCRSQGSIVMRTLDTEYSGVDENDKLTVIRSELVGAREEDLLGEDHFFTSLEALVEFGTGALVVVR